MANSEGISEGSEVGFAVMVGDILGKTSALGLGDIVGDGLGGNVG